MIHSRTRALTDAFKAVADIPIMAFTSVRCGCLCAVGVLVAVVLSERATRIVDVITGIAVPNVSAQTFAGETAIRVATE